jgi:hypothetical protein
VSHGVSGAAVLSQVGVGINSLENFLRLLLPYIKLAYQLILRLAAASFSAVSPLEF